MIDKNDTVTGLIIFHEQLGIGKITSYNKGEESAWVSFLFYAPLALVRICALNVINGKDINVRYTVDEKIYMQVVNNIYPFEGEIHEIHNGVWGTIKEEFQISNLGIVQGEIVTKDGSIVAIDLTGINK